MPVALHITKSELSVYLSGQQYRLKTQQPLPIQQLTHAHSFLLNIVQINGATNQSTLLAIGKALSLALPQALLTVLSPNKDQEKKLQQLAKRKDGYPLPTGQVNGNNLVFNQGPCIKLDMLHSVQQGEYCCVIKSKANQLCLELSPIQFRAEINLISPLQAKPIDAKDGALQPLTNQGSHQESHQESKKTDVNFLYRNLFNILENIDTAPPLSDKGLLSNKDHKTDTSISSVIPANRLAGALEKAGGLPKSAPSLTNTTQSLASVLLTLLPKLAPETLIELSQPQRLKQLIMTTISHTLSPNEWLNTPVKSHTDTISLLFQLLLGRASSSQLSPALAHKISMLQEHLALPEPILTLLQSTAAHRSISALLSNLSLYQQASSQNEHAINYFFALPYSINHYQEQLEGHIHQEKRPNAKDHVWRLRLKFNLATGPLLISAQTLEHNNQYSNSPLKLTFTSSNETLINKVNLLAASLTQKLEGIGFSQVSLSAKKEDVPATILPGEHYLVKVDV
ncbi:hypothetical protein ACVBIL_18200 [Shewanella sp. 125m-7]